MTYKMDVREVCPNIFLIEMNKRNILCRTFMRFQEHYESPEFRGKIFSRAAYKKWYARSQGKSECSYENDWSGFNIPSYVLGLFYKGEFDPLLECEKKLLDQFIGAVGDYYVIGTVSGNRNVLTHEIAHGLWHTNNDYYIAQKALLDSVRTRLEPLYSFLLGMGYCKEVLDDESHAYLCNNIDYLRRKKVDISKLESIRENLILNFNRFSGEYRID